MNLSKLVTQYSFAINALWLLFLNRFWLLRQPTSQYNLRQPTHCRHTILILLPSRLHFLNIAFILGRLLPLLDLSYLVKDGKYDRFSKGFIYKSVWLWKCIEVLVWVADKIPIVFGLHNLWPLAFPNGWWCVGLVRWVAWSLREWSRGRHYFELVYLFKLIFKFHEKYGLSV